MSRFKFKIDGRSVSAKNLGKALTKKLKDQVQSSVKERLESIRCPVHQQPVQVSSVEQGNGKVKFTFNGCCEEAIREAERVMGGRR